MWSLILSEECQLQVFRNKIKVNVYLSSLMMKVPDYVYVLD
jgi:hypothetical protein